jgi:hypothetical protein
MKRLDPAGSRDGTAPPLPRAGEGRGGSAPAKPLVEGMEFPTRRVLARNCAQLYVDLPRKRERWSESV